LAQYHEMARFVKFGAEVDQATLDQLRRGERELEILKQDAHAPLPLEREVVILYAAVRGFADRVAVGQLRLFEEELYSFMEREHLEVLAGIRDSRELSAEIEAGLERALAAFVASFLAAHPVPGEEGAE
jgi:F-type H+-transporting ATPase subunit alpha